MKKIISLILATISMVFSTVTVSAIETNYSQQTQLSYTYEGDYMIYIPMEIDVGENISVMVDNVNILSSKKIVVSVGNFDYDNRIVLTNSNCESYAYAILKDYLSQTGVVFCWSLDVFTSFFVFFSTNDALLAK